MTFPTHRAQNILEKAKSLGASVAGIARVEALKDSPSHLVYPRIGSDLDAHWPDPKDDSQIVEVTWPQDAVSAVVIGVEHGADNPELDWWDGKGTPGNRILMRINRDLFQWLESALDCTTYKLPYLVERGGIFLKDAAVMGSLGCLGENNMVITPEYGPRIRFRALLLNRELEATDPIAFRPCEQCGGFCRTACPVQAFQNTTYSAEELGLSQLPGTDGTYDRVSCNAKMGQDTDEAIQAMHSRNADDETIKQSVSEFEVSEDKALQENAASYYCVKFCRECEWNCPVGQ